VRELAILSAQLPFEVREAVVATCGKAFHYRDPLKSFLAGAGVQRDLIARYGSEAKFVMVRHILAELEAMGEDGLLVERRIVTELCRLRGIPDSGVDDKDGALQALRHLKELVRASDLEVEEERTVADDRANRQRLQQAAIAARAEKMQELREEFHDMARGNETSQRRGYSLEELLAQLFEAHELVYRRPYRTETEQIDGHFQFEGFDYLVEARWRVGPPGEADLAAFKHKVDKKLISTRGLFVSIPGYRQEVVFDFTRGTRSNIVLMNGEDLALILEGHVSLTDALKYKIEKAAQEGLIYMPLRERHV
jgi:hypothetical protein